MKIFVSWSGDFSQAVASLLKKYMPLISHDAELFVSSHDIESGSKWSDRLARELDATNYGIVCLSPTNLQAPWILFEAGALSKFEDSALCSLLIGGLTQENVASPLSLFQNRKFDKNGFRRLVADINAKQSKPLEVDQFELLFETIWPKVDEEYKTLEKTYAQAPTNRVSERVDRELLEEVLFRVRGMERDAMRNFPFESVTPERLLDLPVTHDTLRSYTEWKFPGMDVLSHVQAALLKDLLSKAYPTLREIDDAVNKAQPAVRAYAQEMPDLFTGGTDFITKSLGFVDQGFRERHGFAMITLEAFKKHSNLIKL